MIFKKPYAFLIKYFRIINFILASLAIYVVYRSYNIITFFNDYVLNDYSGTFYKGFYKMYVSPFLIITIILIILGVLGIILLFFYKKKPIKVYIASIAYYIILIIFFNILKNVMISLETNIIAAEASRIYRDLSLISIIPQIFFTMLFIFRGLGIDLKKFEFDKDIKELEVTDNDGEEFEITFKKDGIKLKRNLRRFVREFKYYIKENKLIFIILCIIGVISLIYGIYNSFPEIIDSNYNQGDIFENKNLIYKVEDSIITNIDYKGDIITKDVYYVVVKLAIENTSLEDVTIDYNDIRLVVGKNNVYPILDKGINFIDYATENYSKIIKAQKKESYLIVYQIKEDEISKNYKLKISAGDAIKDNLIVGKFNYVTITPAVVNKVSTQGVLEEGNELSFVNSNLGNTTFKIDNSLITDKYIYTYEKCVKENCNSYKNIVSIDTTKNNKTLLIFNYEYNIDSNVPFYKYSSSVYTFSEKFIKVKYNINGEEKYSNVKNVTPANLNDKIILEASKEIEKADSISISIIVRNKEFLIKIK